MTEPDINSIRNNLINKFDLTRNLSDEEIYSFIDNEMPYGRVPQGHPCLLYTSPSPRDS